METLLTVNNCSSCNRKFMNTSKSSLPKTNQKNKAKLYPLSIGAESGFKPLTIFAKCSILDVSKRSKYTYICVKVFQNSIVNGNIVPG